MKAALSLDGSSPHSDKLAKTITVESEWGIWVGLSEPQLLETGGELVRSVVRHEAV
jgi:hypothetical protein